MKIVFPAYYQDFACVAAACTDSCCHEWTVDVDPVAVQYYKELPGALGDRLRAVLQDTGGGAAMALENGRCPMWRQDGLCRIQAELGHDALCKTCREFPRLQHVYGNLTELDLELSCPEAARLILTSGNQNLLTRTQPGEEEPDYDTQLMELLLESREEALAFLNSSTGDTWEDLAVLLLYAHDVQAAIDGGERTPLDAQALLTEANKYAQTPDLQGLVDFFGELEILTPRWQNLLKQAPKLCQSPHIRSLARYWIRRYWLQTVTDYDLVCRAKFVVAACLVVASVGVDKLQTAQLFSKEIENDPDNVETILDGAYTAPALTDANLLGLLLR